MSKFLPPGFKIEESTTTTTTDTSLIADILSSIEEEDIKKFLPNDFKPKESRPKPPRLFNQDQSTTTKETSNLFDSVNLDDVSAFLPPGFKPTEDQESSSTTKPDFKLDISSLFDNIETDDSLLPPGFNPDNAPKTEQTTEKIVLKFPTRPGGIKKQTESSSKDPGRPGPGLDIPKIKSNLFDR